MCWCWRNTIAWHILLPNQERIMICLVSCPHQTAIFTNPALGLHGLITVPTVHDTSCKIAKGEFAGVFFWPWRFGVLVFIGVGAINNMAPLPSLRSKLQVLTWLSPHPTAWEFHWKGRSLTWSLHKLWDSMNSLQKLNQTESYKHITLSSYDQTKNFSSFHPPNPSLMTQQKKGAGTENASLQHWYA